MTPTTWPLIPNHLARALDLVSIGELDRSEIVEFLKYCNDADKGLAPYYADDQRPYTEALWRRNA